MTIKWSRLLALALALLMAAPVAGWAAETPQATETPTETAQPPADETQATEEASAAEEAPAVAESATQAPLGSLDKPHAPLAPRAMAFTFAKPARNAQVKYYTAIRLHGIEQAVYVFIDKAGVTQFRVYGRAPDAKRGYYVATVTASVSDGPAGWDFTLDVPDTQPVRDAQVFALYKGRNLAKEEVPAGLKKGRANGMYFFYNVFGKRETMFWASADGENYAWYLPNGTRPLAGSPALDAGAFAARMHVEGDKYYRIPKDLAGGYAKDVMIITTDGKSVRVPTDHPPLVMDDLVPR